MNEIVIVNRCKLTEQERHLALASIPKGSRQIDVANEFQVSESITSILVSQHQNTSSVRERPCSSTLWSRTGLTTSI